MLCLAALVTAAVRSGHFGAIPAPTWDTLPLYWFHGLGSQISDDVFRSLATVDIIGIGGTDDMNVRGINNRMCVKINKAETTANYSGCPCCAEDAFIAAARRLKKLANRTHVLAYVNAALAYPWYRASQKLMNNLTQCLRNSTGQLVHNLIATGLNKEAGKESWLAWDYSKGAGKYFAEACLSMVQSGVIDGIFADGCVRTPQPLLNATTIAYEREKAKLMVQLQKQMPDYFTCASTGKEYPGQNGTGAMELQNFGKPPKLFSKREIPMMLKAKAEGVAFMAMGVGHTHRSDPEIITELAAFLIGASERSYWGVSSPHNVTWKRLPLHDKKLGKALGDPILDKNGVYTRSFAAGVHVTYDTKTETGTIKWADDDDNGVS